MALLYPPDTSTTRLLGPPSIARHRCRLTAARPRYIPSRIQCQNPDKQQARTVQELVLNLAAGVSSSAASRKSRYMVSIADVPGSGKTYLADAVVAAINALAERQDSAHAVAVPMDGFHLYRSQLDAMPDPALAHAKRGAHWTFDPARFVQCLKQIRGGGLLMLPSFDHAMGDPVEHDIIVEPSDKIIIVEGLYTLLEQEPWCEVRGLMDEAWFVDCDLEDALAAVIARQVANGASREAAEQRVNSNDRQNGELVFSSRNRATRVLPRLPLV